MPNASTATQVTTLVPSGTREPEGGVQTTGTFGWQVLVAVAVKETSAPPGEVSSATIPVGQLIAGRAPVSLMTQKSAPP